MKRREVLQTMGATLLASLAPAATARPSAPGGDGHFLSPHNPLATAEQRELETRALAIMRMPAVQAARAGIAAQWRTVSGRLPDELARAQFEEMIDEYLFVNVLKAVNGDPNHPGVLAMTFAPPHQWFGLRVPGSRVAGPNPDNIYRQVPVDPAARYVVEGRRFDPAPTDFGFTLVSNIMFTRKLPLLAGQDIAVGADGRFTLTLGPEPANGRANHLQMPPAARWLFVRDSLADWGQVPNAVRVRRLDPPRAKPLGDEQVAELAVAFMIDDLPNSYWWMLVSRQSEPNSMTRPDNTGGVGGLATQQTSFGQARLAPDEAFVVTVGGGGAAYRSLAVYDHWYRCLDPARHMASMSHAQAAPNADGSITYVVSGRDPGAHNWVDVGAQREFLILHRWQGIPRVRDGQPPLSIDTRVVRLDDLRAVLPAETAWVTAAQREAQLARRFAQYAARYVDA